MVDHSSLDVIFKAIADPTRRAMIASLAGSPRTVGELAQPFEISLAAASKHIQMLERAGLVRRTVRGRTHTVRLDAEPLRAGIEWMRRYEKFWSERLDALERELLAEDARATATSQRTTVDQEDAGNGRVTGTRAVPTSPSVPTSASSVASSPLRTPPAPPAPPTPRGPRILPPHERPSRRNSRSKGS